MTYVLVHYLEKSRYLRVTEDAINGYYILV